MLTNDDQPTGNNATERQGLLRHIVSKVAAHTIAHTTKTSMDIRAGLNQNTHNAYSSSHGPMWVDLTQDSLFDEAVARLVEEVMKFIGGDVQDDDMGQCKCEAPAAA